MTPRIATVGYLNAAPLTVDLDRDRYQVIADHPSAIADLLDRGEVDVALVPVAAVLRDPTLRIVPGWCIGARGPVSSVLLVAETPPEVWTEVVLDGESRSSAALTRVLLEGPLSQVDAEVTPIPPGEGVDRARGTTAALVIGDAARDLPDRLTTRLDLAEAWTEWTGLPFVFAVWAGRQGLHPRVIADLREAGRRGLASLEERYGGDDLVYLRDHLRYPLDDAALVGLRRFAALARRAGLVETADVTLYGPAASVLERPDVGDLLDRAAAGERLALDEAHRILEYAPTADLVAAASARRRGTRVSWLPVGDAPPCTARAEATDAGGPAVVPEQVLLDDRQALARLAHRPVAVRGTPAVLAGEGASAGAVLEILQQAHQAGLDTALTLAVGRGERAGDRLAVLGRIRRVHEQSGAIRAVLLQPPPGRRPDLQHTGTTATEYLRLVALARLLLPTSQRVEVPWLVDDDALLQAGLHGGADAVGLVHLGDDWQAVTARVERDIRDAGFEPVRGVIGGGEPLEAWTEPGRRRRITLRSTG